LKKINKIEKPLEKLVKEQRRNIIHNKIRNEKWDGNRGDPKIIRSYYKRLFSKKKKKKKKTGTPGWNGWFYRHIQGTKVKSGSNKPYDQPHKP